MCQSQKTTYASPLNECAEDCRENMGRKDVKLMQRLDKRRRDKTIRSQLIGRGHGRNGNREELVEERRVLIAKMNGIKGRHCKITNYMNYFYIIIFL